MMTEEQQSKVTKVKAAVAASGATREGAPREVQAAAIGLKRELKQAGVTGGAVATMLGVHVSTLVRWEKAVGRDVEAAEAARTKRRRRDVGFRRVEVADSTPAALVPASESAPRGKLVARGRRVAHAPSGLVIDGLDVETLAALLRRMA